MRLLYGALQIFSIDMRKSVRYEEICGEDNARTVDKTVNTEYSTRVNSSRMHSSIINSSVINFIKKNHWKEVNNGKIHWKDRRILHLAKTL